MGIKKAKKEDSFKELFEENYSRLFYAHLFFTLLKFRRKGIHFRANKQKIAFYFTKSYFWS